MYHLRLIKGLSYHGAVMASKDHPDVFTDDAQKYRLAMASGYFEAVSAPDGNAEGALNPSEGRDDGIPDFDTDDAAAKAEQGDSVLSLADMNVTELKAYAALNGIDLTGLKKRDEIETKIREAEANAAEARAALRQM